MQSPAHQLRSPRRPPGEAIRDRERQSIAGRSRDPRLVCRACRAAVTSDDQRIQVAGRHVHRRTNPLGLSFEFGCFAVAPGAVAYGEPSSEDTWFAGFTWRFSLCGGCGTHLGWLYEKTGTGFHGLILNRLSTEHAGENDSP